LEWIVDSKNILKTVLTFLVLVSLAASGPAAAGETSFSYGGFIKLDVLSTYYRNGEVALGNPMRDIHLPSQIPVGDMDENYNLDFHVKESRFHFQTLTPAGKRSLRVFLEMDFLLASQGDEKVSNSFNPRLRHIFLEYGNWLFGQTWTTFMILVLPEDLDFSGAGEGIIFCRQPQVRLSAGDWKISLENPETTVSIDTENGPVAKVTNASRLPDLVVRRDFAGDWGTLGISLLGRELHYEGTSVLDETQSFEESEFGYGLSLGTRVKVGQRDDFLLQMTAGRGVGRYAALNYVNSSALDEEGRLHAIDLVCGFVGYRHWWNEALRTSINISAFTGDNPVDVTGGKVNSKAQSCSVNLLYSPVPRLTLGAEAMYGRRELEDGTDGDFGRLQLSVRYDFGYRTDEDVREKR
jgi:hypothetical protein